MSKRNAPKIIGREKEPTFKRWPTRFSAGGANRTRIHDQIRKLSTREESPPSHFFHQVSSHRPSSSRLPVDRYNYRRDNAEQSGEDEYSPSHYIDSKGRRLQRVGLFRNAKHSDIVQPNIDEQMISRTEETIRKLTRPERHEEAWKRPNTNSVRDRVRQVVYEMGVPNEYREAEPGRRRPTIHEGCSRRRLFSPPPARRFTNPKQNVLYDSGYEPRKTRKSIEEYSDDGRGDLRYSLSPKRHRNLIEYSISQRDLEARELFRKNDNLSNNKRTDLRKRRQIDELGDDEAEIRRKSEDDVDQEHEQPIRKRRSYVVEREESFDKPCSSTSRNSSRSIHSSPRKIVKEPLIKAPDRPKSQEFRSPRNSGYIPDLIEDSDLKWKKSRLFQSPNGEGVVIIDRIGNSMPPLALVDDSEKTYSKVAFSLIGQSMKRAKDYDKERGKVREVERKKEGSKVFMRLMNMSTSWAPSNEYSTILARGGEFQRRKGDETAIKEIMNDISRIRNPQSMLMDESVFANSRYFQQNFDETRIVHNKDYDNNKKKKPVFHSSPLSNPIVNSDEMVTMPSSITKVANSNKNGFFEKFGKQLAENDQRMMNHSDESDEEAEKEDIDAFIEKGASQLTFVHTPEVLSSGSGESDQRRFNFTRNVAPDDDFQQNNSTFVMDKSLNNDPFQFIDQNDKTLAPMLEMNPESQRVFDIAYEHNQARHKSRFQF